MEEKDIKAMISGITIVVTIVKLVIQHRAQSRKGNKGVQGSNK